MIGCVLSSKRTSLPPLQCPATKVAYHDLNGCVFADHLKVTLPTGFAVSRMAWVCQYHKATLERLRHDGEGESNFAASSDGILGTKSHRELFGTTSAFDWCAREVQWGAEWLEQAHFTGGDGKTIGIAVQVPSNTHWSLAHTVALPGSNGVVLFPNLPCSFEVHISICSLIDMQPVQYT
jgi:hypothetical protein